MIDGWIIITAALAYLGFLFAVAYFGDSHARTKKTVNGRPYIYAFSLAVYCTSWTFFGSVGLSATTGFNFIPVYLGPIIFFALGWPLILRIIRLSKTQNITSIADFIAARYGKNPTLAAIVEGGAVNVPLYSDLLLHEILPAGTAGIEDGRAEQGEFRTPPLWGLSATAPYMHNGMADTIDEAIRMHDGEAAGVAAAYSDLDETDRSSLIDFLESL